MAEQPTTNGVRYDDKPKVTKAERSYISELAAYAERLEQGYLRMSQETPNDAMAWGYQAKAEAWGEIKTCLQQSVQATMVGKPPFSAKMVGEVLIQQLRQRAEWEASRTAQETMQNGNGLDTEALLAQDEEHD